VFLGLATIKIRTKSDFDGNMCIPRIDLSNGLSCTKNKDRVQNLRPREVDVLTYPNEAHMTFGTSSLRVRFLSV
jgi:hypothetical protein